MGVSARARGLFLAELAKRGVTPEELDDGAFVVVVGETRITVSLENKGREFDETGDETILTHFVETILAYDDVVPRSWEQAKPRVFLAAEPADHDFGDACRQEASEQVSLVLVYVSDPGGHVVWLTPDLLKRLNVSRERAEAHAEDNLAKLLENTPLETTRADGHTLGMLATHSPLKASLIFAKNLREKVEGALGWPVFAVIPTRDFVYLIPESAQPIFGGIGKVVVGEYAKRGYPVSTEVFRIDDAGARAVGAFQSPLNPPKGMKAVDHDRMLTFFLPKEWEEDTDEDDAPVYFDPQDEENYLSVATQLFTSEGEIPDDQPRRCLESVAEQEGVEVEDWPGGRAAVHYVGEDDGMRVWTWALCGPVGPRKLGLAVFSHHEPLESAEGEEAAARVEMLAAMLPRSLFREREEE
ncbi:MAG: hypothetical protein ACRC33_22040 [Gemmataceae bacterium]